MRCRRAGGKILAGIVLIIFGVIIAVLVYQQWNAAVAPSDGQSYHIVIDSVNFVEPISVVNARWEISLMIRNNGMSDVIVRNVFVSIKPVDENGLVPGDSMSSKSVTGTSLPYEGSVVKSNDRLTISVWIGSDLYSSGNQISLHIFNPRILEYTRYIKLK